MICLLLAVAVDKAGGWVMCQQAPCRMHNALPSLHQHRNADLPNHSLKDAAEPTSSLSSAVGVKPSQDYPDTRGPDQLVDMTRVTDPSCLSRQCILP